MKRRLPLLLFTVLVVLLVAWFGTKAWLEHRVAMAIEDQLILLPDAVRVDYDRVEVELPSLRTHVHGISVQFGETEPVIGIRRLTVHDVDQQHRLPWYLDLELAGVHQNLESSRQPHARFLREVGIGEFAGDLALRYHFDAETERLELDRLLVNLVPLGRLDVAAQFRIAPVTGVLYRDWRPEEAVVLEQLIASWDDKGLVRRMMHLAADAQGMTPASLGAMIAAELDRSAAAFETPRLDTTVETLRHFLPDPGAITLYLEPVEPLPLTELRDTALVNPPRAALDTRLLIEPGRWRW